MNSDQATTIMTGGRGLKAILVGSATSALDGNTKHVCLAVGSQCKISSANFKYTSGTQIGTTVSVTDYDVLTEDQVLIPNKYNEEEGIWSDIVNEGTGQINVYLV